MSSTAMNAPSIAPSVPIHARVETTSAAGARGDVFIGEVWGVDSPRVFQSRTLTFTRAERPGASRPAASPNDAGSNKIFTGTRWTILVKFPVELSGGSSENFAPVP